MDRIYYSIYECELCGLEYEDHFYVIAPNICYYCDAEIDDDTEDSFDSNFGDDLT